MISEKEANDIKNKIADTFWKHEGYFGYSTAMAMVEEEIDKFICPHCSQKTSKENKDA